MVDTLSEVFVRSFSVRDFSFAGRTDLSIIFELGKKHGLDVPELERRLPQLWSRLAERMQLELDRLADLCVLPGVRSLLDHLSRPGMEGVMLGLVTGNMKQNAVAKLRAGGLRAEQFVCGAFGDESADRSELVRLARERAEALIGSAFRFALDQVYVIGDTPLDVHCARAHGHRSIAVATGRYSEAELAQAGADAVLSDLSDLRHVLACLGLDDAPAG